RCALCTLVVRENSGHHSPPLGGRPPFVSLEARRVSPLRRALKGAGGTAMTGLIIQSELPVRVQA
ncbi:hypothetical protein, partial [Alicyclobacillus sendaiensis]|uniref:hypothetical protein n=1 Tax=Alicyclobacillus sendaiensis TaxID=192387 RepID=UPI0026F453AF